MCCPRARAPGLLLLSPHPTRRCKPEGFFREEHIWWYSYQIICGLDYIHSLRIIHRDIKPENIFMLRTDILKIGDFGIAKELTAKQEMAQTSIGTPFYMAPELFENLKYTDAVDIFALGCIVHEMATLKRYAPRTIQSHPSGGQFEFVRLPARTIHPHGMYVWCLPA